jgi:glutamyl endopeptidase
MTPPGHVPITNRDHPVRPERVALESVAPRTSRPSLPSYIPPRGRREVILESGGPDIVTSLGDPPLSDVAVASFGRKDVLEVVIGNDDRIRVSGQKMTSNPWRQICALRIRSKTGRQYVGTAWFIGPRLLATAGHCVYLQDDGGWAQKIEVMPSRFGDTKPFGTIDSDYFGSVNGWVEQRNSDFDYGVIFLPNGDIGTQVGNFEVRSLASSELKRAEAQISGYPADRDSARFQYFHMRPLIDATETRLVYDVDTYGGQSGSPVWQETEEEGVVAVGIHTTGGTTSNSATRVNDAVLDTLIGWAGDTDGD